MVDWWPRLCGFLRRWWRRQGWFTPRSISFRIVIGTLIWSAILLPAAAVTLNAIYRERITQEFDRRLSRLSTLLIASTAIEDTGEPQRPNDFGDALFNLPLATGWYWQIEPLDLAVSGDWPLLSPSRVGTPLPTQIVATRVGGTGVQTLNLDLSNGEALRVVHRIVRAQFGGEDRAYRYVLTGNRGEIERAVADFGQKIAMALGLLGLGILLLTFGLVRFGLRPLRRVQAGLARIRSGEAQRLEGDLPTEVQALQDELNALISANEAIIERARTQVGNLAHALKTPLSVLSNEAQTQEGPLADLMREQSQVMRDQVGHYLDRARLAARSGVIGRATPVAPVLDGLVRALRKIYGRDGIAITLDVQPHHAFQGERHDIEEALGNLVDNACKWAQSHVVVRVDLVAPRTFQGRQSPTLQIRIEDDGPGLTPDQRAAAMKRGERLDESKPGSGLGLSIVRDLADLYDGEFSLLSSDLGGLQAILRLPGAEIAQ